MASRFQKLYSLTPNVYIEGCPILVEAGALQKDTESGAILAQIKMQNIGEKSIESCKISLKAYENNGDEIEGVSDFSYLDLNAEPGMTFGGKTPVIFPNETTRSYSVFIKEIVFADKTVETYTQAEWKSVPQHKLLDTVLTDAEVEKQYGIEVGGDCKYVPEKRDGLFLCTCGGINLSSNQNCCVCGKSCDAQIERLDVSELTEKAESRIEKDRAQKAAQDEAKRIKNEKLKRTTKMIVLTVTVVAILSCIAAVTIPKVKIANTYKQANQLMAEGKYQEAKKIYSSLEGYKDSNEKSAECDAAIQDETIQSAKDAFSAGNYGQVVILLKSIKGNEDAIRLLYDSGQALLDNKKYAEAKEAFESTSYGDSSDYAKYCGILDELNNAEHPNLTEIYNNIKSLDDFNDVGSYLKENKYLSDIDKLEGTKWQCVEESGYEEYGWGADEITVTIKDAEVIIDSYRYCHDAHIFTVADDKLAIILNGFTEEIINGKINPGDNFDYDYLIDIVKLTDDKLEIKMFKTPEGEETKYLKAVKAK